MRVRFWGVRGSYPVPSAETARYGGHTSCLEVTLDDERRPVVLDAGTGLPELGRALLAGPLGRGEGTVRIFLSHLHWDHVLGLPLFMPAYIPGNRVVIYGRKSVTTKLRDAVLGSMRPELFPLRFDKAPANIEYVEVHPGEPFEIEGARVTAMLLNHPFGSLAYRFDASSGAFAYVTDTSPFSDILYPDRYVDRLPETLSDDDRDELARRRRDLVAGLRGADVAVYDTQYTEAEYQKTPHFGHGTAAHALEVLRDAEVPRLMMFHHAPGRTDTEMDRQLADAQAAAREHGIEVDAARQGGVLDV